MEYEVQFENSKVVIAKVKILPHEEIGLHRDDFNEVIVAQKGGTITRQEPDGRLVEIHFPAGEAVFRPIDPPNELHKSFNNSSEPLELIVIRLKD